MRAKKILVRILFLNWLVALAKIFIGVLAGSLSILADGFHSLFDGVSNILGWIGVKIAERPRDSVHPYGHRKFGTLASLGIAILISITGYEFLKSAIQRFFQPVVPDITLLSFVVMGGVLLVNIFVYYYENSQGRKLNSTILIADSFHSKTHLFTTPAVILGMIAIRAGFPVFDPILAALVIFVLGKLVWEIVREVVPVLSDKVLVDVNRIKDIVRATLGVKSSHQIRTRGDKNYVFLDMHIGLDPNLSLEKAHRISHNLRQKIMKEIPRIKDVVIHFEPEKKEHQCR